jgi:hypothetical protein
VELLQLLIENSVSSVVSFSTASSKPTFSIITSQQFPSTMLMKPPKPSNPSWAAITEPIPKMASSDFYAPCGATFSDVNGSNLWKEPLVRMPVFCSSATEMGRASLL